MKQIFFALALVIGSASAQAADCSFVCNQMGNSNLARQCRQVNSTAAFLQRSACEVCAVPASDYTTLDCMQAIQNKSYSSSEIYECKTYNSTSGIVTCMTRNGSPHYGNDPYPSPRCDLARLNRQIDGAINNYHGGNYQAVINTLNNMKSELRSCQQ